MMDQCLNLLNEALSSECFQPRKLNCQMWLKASNKLIHHRGPGAAVWVCFFRGGTGSVTDRGGSRLFRCVCTSELERKFLFKPRVWITGRGPRPSEGLKAPSSVDIGLTWCVKINKCQGSVSWGPRCVDPALPVV